MSENNILHGLNEPQRAAVENYKGATLIIAGAGSGKTRTLTARIAHMLEEGVKPWNVLTLTFTNKAAKEMTARIRSAVDGSRLRGIYMGTFHGVFRRLLSENASLLGFPADFTIYDSTDSQNLIKSVVKDLNLNTDLYKPRPIASRISLAKNNLILPDVYAQKPQIIEEDRQMRMPQLCDVYREYFRRLKGSGAMDYDDILLYMNILLRDFPEVCEKLGQQFEYILVDEYQDTNSSQYLILKRLAQFHRNICVVGDDSQSIYSFRGAKIENILKFQTDYPEAQVIKLEQNYRSTQNIVDAANSLIERNSQKLPKRLFSAGDVGEKLTIRCNYNERNEAEEVARSIQSGVRVGESPSNYAILYRTNAQSRSFEDALRHRNLPYKIYGGQSFYQRAEIKDMLAYFKLAVNPKDDQAMNRIVNFPARGIGATSLAKVSGEASARGLSMLELIMQFSPSDLGIRGTAVKGLENFRTIFSNIYNDLTGLDAYEFAHQVAVRSGVLQYLQNSKLTEDESRLQNVEELLSSIKEYVDSLSSAQVEGGQNEDEHPQVEYMEAGEQETSEENTTPSIGAWLSEVSLLTDMDEEKDDTPRITLLTVHASKGLEFKHTYIVGMEENLFPSSRCEMDSEIEEERRIFYVALTRAERSVTLSFAQSRFRFGSSEDMRPSRFLGEIDPQYLQGDVDMLSGGRKNIFEQNLETHNARYGGKKEFSPSPAGSRAGSSYGSSYGSHSGSRPAPSSQSMGKQNLSKIKSPSSIMGDIERKAVSSSGKLVVGARVAHARFGEGVVSAMEKIGADVRVTVDFKVGGSKTLLEKFAKLTVL